MRKKTKKSANPLAKLFRGRKSITVVLGACLAIFAGTYITMAKFSADSAVVGPTECSLGSVKNDGSLVYKLSQKSYQVEVYNYNKKNPVAGKKVSIYTTYAKNLKGTAGSNNLITEGTTDGNGKVELTISRCLATVDGETRYFLGNESVVYTGNLIIRADGYKDKVIKNKKFAKGFTPSQYQTFIRVSEDDKGKKPSRIIIKQPINASSSKATSSQATSTSTSAGNISLTPSVQSSDLYMTLVVSSISPTTGKRVYMDLYVPYEKLDIELKKESSGNSKVPYNYYMKYSKESSETYIKKIFVWEYKDSSKTSKKVITSVYMSFPFKGSQDSQAENYFKGQLNILNNNVAKYVEKKSKSAIDPASKESVAEPTQTSVDKKSTASSSLAEKLPATSVATKQQPVYQQYFNYAKRILGF